MVNVGEHPTIVNQNTSGIFLFISESFDDVTYVLPFLVDDVKLDNPLVLPLQELGSLHFAIFFRRDHGSEDGNGYKHPQYYQRSYI